MTELKTCPFCGGEGMIVEYFINGIVNRKHYYCECKACGARINSNGGYKTKAKAVEAWSRRATNANGD